MKGGEQTNFYKDFQTLEDIEKEIQNELKQLANLNNISNNIFKNNHEKKESSANLNSKPKEIEKQILAKTKKKVSEIKKIATINNNKTNKNEKNSYVYSKKFIDTENNDPTLYERLENEPKSKIIPSKKGENLNERANYLKNDVMPHETDYMNPYVKSYFQPNFQIIKQNILMENSEMNKQKNTTNKMKKNNISSDSNHTFKPMLLKKSLIMAEKMGDTMSRLTKESISKSKEKIINLNHDVYGKYNFKPEINKTSQKIMKKKREKSAEKNEIINKPRWEELYSLVFIQKNICLFCIKYKEKEKEREVQKIEKEIKQYDDPELTFQPKITKNHYVFIGENDMNLVERNKFWRKNIEEKLHDQRKSLESKGLEFCTFQPNLSKIKQSKSTHDLDYNPSNFNKMGIIRHFERIDLAKKKKQEKEVILNKFNGTGWKNQVTVPKEYTFKNPNKEIIQRKKSSEFSEFYNKVFSKTNRSTSVTNMNFSKTSWDLSESSEADNKGDTNNYETAVMMLHKELHNIDF